MTAFESLTDDRLLALLRTQGEACERIIAMPVSERRRQPSKHACSPEQVGTVNAMFAILLMEEAERRGL